MSAVLKQFNKAGEIYMPIKLKGVLAAHGIRQIKWSDSVIQTSGQKLSSSAATQIMNWNTWPKNTPKAVIIKQTEDFLRSQGVPQTVIDTIWDIDEDDSMRGQHPAGVHVGQYNNRATKDEVEPLGEPEMLSPNAMRQFKFFRDPFKDEVNSAEDVYTSPDIRYIRECMFTTAKHGGLLAVVGESGGGKSILRRDLIDRISRDNEQVRIIFPRCIDKKNISAGSLCEAIIRDLQPDEQKIPQSLESKARLVEKILVASAEVGNKHCIILEEAHDLTIKTMKLLKRFWELEDGFNKLISIILIGQPELTGKLDESRNPEAREFIRRCQVSHLEPLDSNLEDYLKFKFGRANKALDEIFEDDAFDAIRQRLVKRRSNIVVSMLNPLLVNNTVTKALNQCAEIQEEKVSAAVIAAL